MEETGPTNWRDSFVRKFVVTIDTNSTNARQAGENLNALEEWRKKGLVEVVKTDVMDTEFLKAA
jgi:hypothetical protein